METSSGHEEKQETRARQRTEGVSPPSSSTVVQAQHPPVKMLIASGDGNIHTKRSEQLGLFVNGSLSPRERAERAAASEGEGLPDTSSYLTA